MENFQDRGVWIRIRIRFVMRGWIRIRFVLRGWIRILLNRSISDRIRNSGSDQTQSFALRNWKPGQLVRILERKIGFCGHYSGTTFIIGYHIVSNSINSYGFVFGSRPDCLKARQTSLKSSMTCLKSRPLLPEIEPACLKAILVLGVHLYFRQDWLNFRQAGRSRFQAGLAQFQAGRTVAIPGRVVAISGRSENN